MVGAAVLDTVLRYVFLTLSGRVGQAVLLDLRRRVFDHVQRLPLAFHERYTSGRTISRLTTDVDALAELLDEGLDNLVSALLRVVIDRRHPARPRPAARRWSRCSPSRRCCWSPLVPARTRPSAYRRTRETIAALIVQFTETLGGIRAVQAFRREPRNEEIFTPAQRGQPPAPTPRVLADRRVRARRSR